MVGCGIVILLVWLLLSTFLETVCPRVEQCVHREGLYFGLVLLREARYVQTSAPRTSRSSASVKIPGSHAWMNVPSA